MTMRTLIYRRKPTNRTILALILALIVWPRAGALAQNLMITNLTQWAKVAFSSDYSFYLPWMPWQWEAYSIYDGEPWWVDCSQVACMEFPSASTNLSADPLTQGVQLIAVRLTKNVLTGVTTLQPDGSTNVIAVIAATNGYQVCSCSEDEWVLREWRQVTNCPSCWGVSAGTIPPPTVTLRALLADLSQYPIYESNMEAQAEAEAVRAAAWAASKAATPESFNPLFSIDCTITNDSAPFTVVSISQNSNYWITTSWQSCTDHVYVVQTESSLTPTSSWTDAAWMFGTDQATSWTDTNSASFPVRFYRVVRGNPNTLNNGVPYGWAVGYGLDPLDPNLALEDPMGDGYSNLEKYLLGLNPNQYTNPPSGGSVTTVRYYYDPDGRLIDGFYTTVAAVTYSLTPGHNMQGDNRLHQ